MSFLSDQRGEYPRVHADRTNLPIHAGLEAERPIPFSGTRTANW